jgi:hypothetical protein
VSKTAGIQFGLWLGKMESQKTSCINILESWLNIPTNELYPEKVLKKNFYTGTLIQNYPQDILLSTGKTLIE